MQEDVAWVQPGWEISPVETLLPGKSPSLQLGGWLGAVREVDAGAGW